MAKNKPNNQRVKILYAGFLVSLFFIILRLFYWQVIKAASLQAVAANQTISKNIIKGQRGRLYTIDGHLLVGNQTIYQLFINKKELKIDQLELINRIVLIINDNPTWLPLELIDGFNLESADEADLPDPTELVRTHLLDQLAGNNSWVKLFSRLTPELKHEIEAEQIIGLHFLEDDARYYPEGSMAAHLTGFVGKNNDNQNIGYFGVEGALNKELGKHEKTVRYRQDATGKQFTDQKLDFSNLNGRDVTLTLRRDIQFIAETSLEKGMKNFLSSQGEIVIMNPKTGEILALATWPHYDPNHYQQFSTEEFKNPAVANLYEPGSIFKPITIATGIDLEIINPETICTKCSGPRVIGGYTIKTWNEEYHPEITVAEALRKSDNIAMIFIAEQIGAEKFLTYLQNFGFGEPLDIDLQEDVTTPFPESLRPVELATISFGQGISANSIQVVRAIGVIANQGVMMKPTLIKQVYDPYTSEKTIYDPEMTRRVISAETARLVTEMMIEAAPNRPNWINQNYLVAGKTGTSQIPSPDGGYQEEGTIASYVGFAPADDPKFVMLVKLTEPQASQWGATTAVPIWYEVADKLMMRL